MRAAHLRLAMQNERGLDARWVTPAQAAELLPLLDPQRILGATFCEQDGAISPPRNVAAYLVMMREHGVRLRERAPVVRLRVQGGRVTGVETPDGVIAAEHVILAGGVGQGALGAMAGVAPPVGGVRHHVFVTSPAPELAAGPLPMGFDVEAGLYWRQEEGGLLFGISDPGEAPGEARGIDEATQHAAREHLARLLPMTRALGLRKAWAATIDYTPDHLPILGPALGQGGEPIEGLTVASRGGPRDDVGSRGGAHRRRPRAARGDRRDRRVASWASIASTPPGAAAWRPTRSRCRSPPRSAPDVARHWPCIRCTGAPDRSRMARMNNGVLPQRPEFEVTVSTDDGVRVVAVTGELDLDTMVELNEVLAADNGLPATTVVDLRGLTFIDSSGVSGVLAAARRARDAGARFVCVPGPPQIRRVFELTGVDTVLEWVGAPGEVA